MRYPYWKHFIIVFLLSILVACGSSEEDEDPPVRGDLVSATLIGNISSTDYELVIAALGALGIDTTGMTAKYNVGSYRIVYKTQDTSGNLINASGVIALPGKPAGALSPMLGFQHATILTDAEAPSNTAVSDTYTLLAASLGYIMVLPDYIGFGESSNRMHTYVHAQGLANATVDMLRAAKQFLAKNSIGWNNQLFITGYSEGGYANMAAHRELETNMATEFTVTAAVHGGGPYDVRGTMDLAMAAATQPAPAYVGYVFKAYDVIYSLNSIATAYQAVHTGIIDTYYDGTHSSSAIDAALGTTVTAELFNAAFLVDYLDAGDAAYAPRFDANQVYNWVPTAPTGLYHGVNDEIVPYANATTALAAMDPLATGNVELQTCIIPVDAHTLCVPGYLDYMIDFFSPLAQDL